MSKEVVLFLDYDGTLAEIVNDPDKAYLSDEANDKFNIACVIIFSSCIFFIWNEQMYRTLQDVTKCYRTSIVSGRAIEKVSNLFYLACSVSQVSLTLTHI